MDQHEATSYIAFAGHRRVASGTLVEVAMAAKSAADGPEKPPVAVFEFDSGRPVDLDLHGSPEQVRAKAEDRTSPPRPTPEPRRGPGRPRLGVVSREISLLPRHWDWLAEQPGGASASLRRLVDDARHRGAPQERARHARDSAYRFMYAMAGDLAGFEEALRALYRNEWDELDRLAAAWPVDVRDHARTLADRARQAATEAAAADGSGRSSPSRSASGRAVEG